MTNKLPSVMDGCSLALFAYAGNSRWPLGKVALVFCLAVTTCKHDFLLHYFHFAFLARGGGGDGKTLEVRIVVFFYGLLSQAWKLCCFLPVLIACCHHPEDCECSLGFFRDAPFYHVSGKEDAPIVESTRQGGKDGSCGFS